MFDSVSLDFSGLKDQEGGWMMFSARSGSLYISVFRKTQVYGDKSNYISGSRIPRYTAQ